jgi:hypothetical protein
MQMQLCGGRMQTQLCGGRLRAWCAGAGMSRHVTVEHSHKQYPLLDVFLRKTLDKRLLLTVIPWQRDAWNCGQYSIS